jgi:NTP pyrophosphatase (non-canonical NTP hydrolase)
MTISELCKRAHQTAKDKGFWSESIYEIGNPKVIVGEQPKERNDGELLMLMVSELGEALEALRHGNPPSEHIPKFSALDEEMADLAIRLGDFCQARGIDLDKVLEAKMNFNDTREYKHGKKF